MHGHGDLVRGREHPGVRHLPGLPRGILEKLRATDQLPGQPQGLGGGAPLQPALRGCPQPVGEVIHGLRQTRCIGHGDTVRAAPGLLPTGEPSGTVT